MASLPACACCGDPVSTAPRGLCKTCLDSSGDGDGALCPGCFALHEKGAAGKGSTRGHAFTSVPASTDDSSTTFLVAAGLTPCTTRCAVHPSEPVRIACDTCHEPALCALCAISRHSGHSLVVASDAAPAARAKLREAASPADDSSAVNAARAHAQRVSSELSGLPARVEKSEQRIEELRNTLVAAANARCAALLAELAAGASRVRDDVQVYLERADTLLRDATSAAAHLMTAADKLSDIDVVCHADALLARAAALKESVAALPPRPAVTGAVSVEIDPAAKAALLGSIGGVGKVLTGLASLIAEGEGDDTLEAKGSRVSALRASGYDVASLRSGGYELDALRAGGFDPAALYAGGFSVASLRTGGVDDASLLAAGLMSQIAVPRRGFQLRAIDGSC